MADHLDLRIEQANAAIRDLIQRFPGGRIPADQLPEYDQLVRVWVDAVNARRDEESGPLAA